MCVCACKSSTHLILEAGKLLGSGVGQTESLDCHLPVPASTVDLSHGAPPHPLQNLDVIVRDIPLVNDADAVLE